MTKTTEQVGNSFWRGEIAKGSSVRSTGDKLYSYATVILQRLSSGVVIGNLTKYSHTTSVHQTKVNVKGASIYVKDVPTGTSDLQPYINREQGI